MKTGKVHEVGGNEYVELESRPSVSVIHDNSVTKNDTVQKTEEISA